MYLSMLHTYQMIQDLRGEGGGRRESFFRGFSIDYVQKCMSEVEYLLNFF